MSRIDELKKQYKEFAVCDLDIMKMMVPDQANKYTEMLAKLTRNLIDNEYNNQFGSIQNALRKDLLGNLIDLGIDYNYLETLETQVLYNMYNRINSIIGRNRIQTFNKFAQLNERKLIENNDVTSYKSFEEVEQAVSLAEMKLIDKELEKQIKKVYEDDTWLSLRPLSLEASMKYGANTKWCTTTESGQYYARYSSRGVLIYNINKKTGYKVACFKNLSPDHDNEFSWWDVTDRKIEALDSEAPSAVLEAIRNEIKNTSVPNSMLMTKAESDKLEMYKEGYGPNDPRLHISGGFTSIGTNSTLTVGGSGNTLVYNPSTFTTTGTSIFTSGTIGMGTTTPNTQLSITGNVEINDGDLILRSGGEERMRITSTGGDNIGLFEPQPLTVAESRQRLQELMDEMVNEANERVVEERIQQQTLLGDLELGTLSEDYKRRMQALAGIDINGVTVKLNGVEIVDEREAEQTDVPLVEKKRKSGKSWINKLWSRLN